MSGAAGASLFEHVSRHGWGIADGVVPPPLIHAARDATAATDNAGLRNPLSHVGALRAIADCDEIQGLIRTHLGGTAMIVRAILFDKTPKKNWPVTPHRDTTIAVRERHDAPGYGPWSEKSGVIHCRPPREILASMLTFRVALDGADASNGPLRVLPGSHLDDREQPWADADESDWSACLTEPGDVVLMRPLLVHASCRAERPSRRRVLHLECAPAELPPPLEWAGV